LWPWQSFLKRKYPRGRQEGVRLENANPDIREWLYLREINQR
jgi:hypothetical protein